MEAAARRLAISLQRRQHRVGAYASWTPRSGSPLGRDDGREHGFGGDPNHPWYGMAYTLYRVMSHMGQINEKCIYVTIPVAYRWSVFVPKGLDDLKGVGLDGPARAGKLSRAM